MKKLCVITAMLYLLTAVSCNNSGNSQGACPDEISDSYGNFEPYLSAIDQDNDINQDDIYVKISSISDCDGVNVKLTGAITASFTARYTGYSPYLGGAYYPNAGQTIQYNGINYKINGSNLLTVKPDGELSLNVIALNSGSTSFLQIVVQANRM